MCSLGNNTQKNRIKGHTTVFTVNLKKNITQQKKIRNQILDNI